MPGEEQSLAQFWKDAPNADRQDRAWLQGPNISKDDCLKGSTRVQKVSAKEWWSGLPREYNGPPVTMRGAGNTVGARPEPTRIAVKTVPSSTKPAICHLRKHKGVPWAIVQDEDPGYFNWAVQNVSGVEAAVRNAGLLEKDLGNDADSEGVDPDDPYGNGSWCPNH